MDKREFIKHLGLVLGATASTQFLAPVNAIDTALAYTPRMDTLERDGKCFNREELRILHDICAHVIPADETPGAAELDVHGFMDNQLFHCHSKAEQESMRAILHVLEDKSRAAHDCSFDACDEPDQRLLLEQLDTAQQPFDEESSQRFRAMKAFIAVGYFTTEVGASRVLQYIPYPGGFRGSVPWSTADRARFR